MGRRSCGRHAFCSGQLLQLSSSRRIDVAKSIQQQRANYVAIVYEPTIFFTKLVSTKRLLNIIVMILNESQALLLAILKIFAPTRGLNRGVFWVCHATILFNVSMSQPLFCKPCPSYGYSYIHTAGLLFNYTLSSYLSMHPGRQNLGPLPSREMPQWSYNSDNRLRRQRGY